MDRIDTPEKVKEYLTSEGIDYDNDADDGWLYTLAKRRLKRRLFNDGTPMPRKSRNIGVPRSLKDLLKLLSRLEAKAYASGEEEIAWPTVRYTIEDMPDPGTLVCLKHQTADREKCTGIVEGGICKGCNTHVPGVPAFSFNLLARDTVDETVKLGVRISDKGAYDMFHMRAAQFRALTLEQQGRAIEEVEGETFSSKMIVRYNPDDDDFFVCAFACA